MDAYQAIADPVRRHLIETLAPGEHLAGELAAEARSAFGLSQPATSKHLRALRDAGLVECRTDGPRRIYRLCPQPIAEVADWAARQAHFWNTRLDALEDQLHDEDQR